MSIDVWTAVVMVAAGALVGFTGFGFNIIAVPLLVLWRDPAESVVLALLVGTTLSAVAAFADRATINRRVLSTLILGCAPGLVVGLLLIPAVDDRALRLCVGAATVGAAALLLPRRNRPRLEPSRPAEFSVGATSGAFTALLGMGGPPVVAYLLARPDVAEKTRSTVLAHIAIAGAAAIGLRAALGGIAADTIGLSAVLLIPALVGVGLGALVFRAAPALHAAASVTTIAAIGGLGVALAVGSYL